MPRNELQNELLREQSKAKILEAAMSLFARYGYEGTSVRMIAQKAGIAQGLLYNYFASKDDLLRALFARSMEDVQASFAAAELNGEPRERIERLIRASFEILRQHPDFWRLSYSVRTQLAVLASVGSDVQGWTQTIVHTLEEHLRALGVASPEIEAAILFALIDGVSQHYLLNPDDYPLQAVIDTLVAKYGGPAETLTAKEL